MRRLATSLLAVALITIAVSCKRKPDETPATPTPTPTGTAPAPAEDTVDALTPPPPIRDLAVKADTVNGHPNGPNREALDAAQADAQKKIQVCLDALPAKSIPGGQARLLVRYVIQTNGKTDQVSVEGTTEIDVINCGKRTLEAASFPPFEGNALANAFSLTYSRPQSPPDLSAPPTK